MTLVDSEESLIIQTALSVALNPVHSVISFHKYLPKVLKVEEPDTVERTI